MSDPRLTALASAVLRLPRDPERVLVVGCGEGEGVLFLAREFPAARVRGIDRSGDAVRAASGRVGLDPEGRVAFKRDGGRAFPFPDELFDLVVQTGGRARPRELARVLRPGGGAVMVGRWRWLDWRLRMHGFEALETGGGDGAPFTLARLGSGA